MASKKVKIISWNINGYRAAMKKNFLEIFQEIDADIFTMQEIKMQQDQLSENMKDIPGYRSFFSFSIKKKGYSGIAAYTKMFPKFVGKGIGLSRFDDEGRILQIDFDNFIFFSVYFPNGQMNEERLIYKLDFYDAFFNHVENYKKKGYGIVIVGDFNIAHNNIDLKHPTSNSKRSGFLPIERKWIDKILKNGYIDSFRFLYPNLIKYSWWSYRFNSRKNNVGWRIDYCFVSQNIIDKGWLEDAFICNDIFGSDHCPIGIILNMKI